MVDISKVLEHFFTKWANRRIHFPDEIIKKLSQYARKSPLTTFEFITNIDHDLEIDYNILYKVMSQTEIAQKESKSPWAVAKVDLDFEKGTYNINLVPPPKIEVDYETGEVIDLKTGEVIDRLTKEQIKYFSPYDYI